MSSRRIELQRANGLVFGTLLSEVSLETGDLSGARKLAEKLIHDTNSPEARSIAHRVLAAVNARALDFEASLSQYRTARALGRNEVSPYISAGVELSFWSRFS